MVLPLFILSQVLLFGMNIGVIGGQEEVIYSTSILGLAELKKVEELYIARLVNYTDALQKKVEALKTFIETVNQTKFETVEERMKFVSNPLNAFGLVRRVHVDLQKIQKYIKKRASKDLREMENLLAKAPSDDDMNEALKGMHRIQKIYDLQATDLFKGLLSGVQYNARLSSYDCLAIADYIFNKTEYTRAAEWYKVGLYYFKPIVNRILKQIFNIDHLDTRKKYLLCRLKINGPKRTQQFLAELTKEPKAFVQETLPTTMELGCRELFAKRNRMRCRYNFTTTPFLRLAPMKMEEISRYPPIWLYHDVISDSDIATLTSYSLSDLSQGWTDQYKKENEKERTFQTTPYYSDGGPLDKRLHSRIVDMTGLDVGSRTNFKVANYGLGGYFPNHTDFLNITKHPSKYYNNKVDDRLATVIFYIGDVPQGGNIVFPRARISVRPQKGTALFWYNLHNDGKPNMLSEHTVCPVIVGNKWTLTSSILEREQMFLKPCYK
ncbi:prolyl 4-hydroxylase subunit alpha-1-like [Scaptodrosophila lebanonensis]|uniref:procollagen-proline 4-dioxygenase n=1 Tax=Drosophila lebanonensis TaxID=7225 RepID=A0A6J2TD41_DROLE|nr:prolyl 4-hydroxylase subunit alpha-1-like [Scaptodrosophila lebanonensis]